jgi:hypothetical protein
MILPFAKHQPKDIEAYMGIGYAFEWGFHAVSTCDLSIH